MRQRVGRLGASCATQRTRIATQGLIAHVHEVHHREYQSMELHHYPRSHVR